MKLLIWILISNQNIILFIPRFGSADSFNQTQNFIINAQIKQTLKKFKGKDFIILKGEFIMKLKVSL